MQYCENFTTLSSLFNNNNLQYTRQQYYDNYTFYDLEVTYGNLDDVSWMIHPPFAGVRYMNLTGSNVDWPTLQSVKSEIIALKNSGLLRLDHIYLQHTPFDTKVANGTYPKCENGQLSEYMQWKKDLLDVGIMVYMPASSLSWHVIPTC